MHDPGSLFRPGGQGRTANHYEDCDSTLSNVQELRLQVREPKRGNDQVGEHAKTADDEGGSDLKHDIAPDDGVGDGLDHLVALVRLVLDTSLVCSHALDHEALLVLVEALCRHGRVGQPPADEGTPGAGRGAKDEEQKLPRLDVVAIVVRGSPSNDTANLDASISHIHKVWVSRQAKRTISWTPVMQYQRDVKTDCSLFVY